MISYLRMENFRRHAETELRFDETGQIVLIAGVNGAGKSSIIEAILYALYGEGRHGNRWLERMVRRGAELEGMEVELEFDVAGEIYRVKRRRDNKISSAVLWGNDVALTEGAREVSAEVGRILGMDARGFRLAVVAQQKELDGLAAMRPGERGSMLSRLLRLDAVTGAKDGARVKYRGALGALRALGSVEGAADIQAEIERLSRGLESTAAAVSDGESAMVLLDADLAATSGIEALYVEARDISARAAERATSAREEEQRVITELHRIQVVEVDTSGVDLAKLMTRAEELRDAVAKGEAAQRLVEEAAATRHELEGVETRIDAISRQLVEADLDEGAAEAQVTVALEKEVAARATLGRGRDEATRLTTLIGEAAAKLAAAAALGAQCETCGQVISGEHREAQHERAAQAETTLEELLARIDLGALKTALSEATMVRELSVGHLEEVRANRRLVGEREDLVKRRETYQRKLERLGGEAVDLAPLYAARGEVETALVVARDVLDRASLAEMARQRRGETEERWRQAVARRESLEEEAESARVDTDLAAAHERRQMNQAARGAEFAVLSSLREEMARGAARIEGAKRELSRVAAMEERRRELETEGLVASLTADVLDKVATTLNQQIRPQLEGSVAEILARMSDGRFDAVRLDEDYTLSVRDDGEMRPLGEFSGGEIDLIALAVRLALAEVVSDRQGRGGAGFLILDECFGSQDADRRGSIMTALRALRGAYGQILLISHVGGLEDLADVVVEVTRDPVTGMTTATTET